MKDDVAIGQIGDNFTTLKQVDFTSKESLFDYDILFFDPNYITRIYNSFGPDSAERERVTLLRSIGPALERRANEIAEFVEKGKQLIVFTPFSQMINLESDRDWISNILDLLPCTIYTRHSEGTKIDIVGTGPWSALLTKHLKKLRYRAHFDTDYGQVLAAVETSNYPISLIYENVVFLPEIEDMGSIMEVEFLKEVKSLVFVKEKESFKQPEWAEKYTLPNEENTLSRLAAYQEKIDKLNEELNKEQKILTEIIELKTLFTGTGNELEEKVKYIFEKLGFEFIQTESHRDDLIIKYKERIAVVEIKGVSGSAAEKQAAQLEKWVSEYHISNGIKAKGILIVNGSKDKELKLRTEPIFPNQMLNFSEKREHCLMTGTQLLGLFFEIQKNESKKEEIINSLFDTVGIYDGFTNWTSYIDYKN